METAKLNDEKTEDVKKEKPTNKEKEEKDTHNDGSCCGVCGG